MAPKSKVPRPFPGAKGKGALEPLAAGVIFGLLFGGKTVREVMGLMNVSRPTVFSAARSVAEELGVPPPVSSRSASREPSAAQDDEEGEDDTGAGARGGTPLAKQVEIDARRALISEVMAEVDADGNFVVTSAREVARRLVDHGVIRSPRTMSRDLRTMGMRWLVRPATADMTEAHLARRVAMAEELMSYDERDILFSDESQFDCRDVTRCAWKRPGVALPPRRVARWSARASVWGCVGVGFRLLVFLPKDRVTSEVYKKTLSTHLLPILPPNKVFMQDGAPAHTSRDTIEFLRCEGVTVLPWPSKSPDLNPIENIWSRMKSKIKVEHQRKEKDLRNAIASVWESISQDEIDSLCLGFHARVAEMQRRSGEDCQIPSRLLK